MKHILTILLSLVFAIPCISQQVYYSGKTISDPYRHDGGLSPVIGVHNIQIMRADREHPDSSRNIMPWTYNHQPMMAYWKGRFWVHYLSDPQSEHVPPSQTFFQTSADGYHWTSPATLFPDYGNDMMAVMHQRVGWYVSSKKTGEKLLAIGSYGLCPTPKSDPNDGNGIGRVVREVKEDGTLGPIYFLYLNKGLSPAVSKGEGEQITEKKIIWPLYTKSKDRRFREACDEIMSSPLYWMQFVEECDRGDARLPLKNVYKAFSYYTLPDDNTIVGLWKHALTSQSHDGGKTWTEPVARARGFVNSNAKIWGQRLSDGSYATVYNPAEYRWPLAVSTSVDGIEYTTLSLVQGEISPMRYGGNYKSYGPQYVRGILPGNGTPPDGNMWVSYSMNKEDMWVAKIPVPLRTEELLEANDNFSNTKTLDLWNINSLILAPVGIENGWLSLADEDPYDYARAERVIPATRRLSVSFDVKAMQNDHGMLQMDFLDEKGSPCSRLQWQPDGNLMVKVGARYNNVLKGYEAGRAYHLQVDVDLDARNVTIWVDGKKVGPRMLFAPVGKITRIAFRTGEQRFSPTPDTPADRLPGDDLDLSNLSPALSQGEGDKYGGKAQYLINNLRTGTNNNYTTYNINHTISFPHSLIDYFNNMEDENIVQAIPNSESAEWMERNVPRFECPDKQLEQMYYYRWWTLRKAIRETPVGYVFNEFLVERSYADKYNLIACALGHHIMEARWLRDSTYLSQYVNVWLRGDEGKPMFRLDTFSSWLPYAMMQRSLVLGSKDWMKEYNLDLQADVRRWEESNSYGDGLFWQRDVKDGMEEQISGGRKVNNRRPTINSYMYGNYKALAWLNEGSAMGREYEKKADDLRSLIDGKLWNKEMKFYGTLTTADTLAKVREQIGYIPWCFNLPADDAERFAPAWKQLMDEKGFDAPFGITTAERRHPLFRKRYRPGKPSCEWDGAVWPFATSQTLTALINVMNNYPVLSQAISADSIWHHHLKKYVECQSRRGRPYIGEYLDEKDGQWLMGDRERSRYYNHSTFCDLIITGICGLTPRLDDEIELHPHIPDSWDYFCLDGVPYHGKLLTIIYDRNGDHYHQGKGLFYFVKNHN